MSEWECTLFVRPQDLRRVLKSGCFRLTRSSSNHFGSLPFNHGVVMLCCFLCLVLFFTQYILYIYIYSIHMWNQSFGSWYPWNSFVASRYSIFKLNIPRSRGRTRNPGQSPRRHERDRGPVGSLSGPLFCLGPLLSSCWIVCPYFRRKSSVF